MKSLMIIPMAILFSGALTLVSVNNDRVQNFNTAALGAAPLIKEHNASCYAQTELYNAYIDVLAQQDYITDEQLLIEAERWYDIMVQPCVDAL